MRDKLNWLSLPILALGPLLATAPAAQARPVLVEMFTSQSCSSCPPADALLRQLAAADTTIFPLSLNVTYWNQLAWHDTDSLDAATARQYWYAGLPGGGDVYTPEAVVDGTAQLVGSDAGALSAAIAAAKAAPAGNVPIMLTAGPQLTVRIGAGAGAARVTLFGYDALHTMAVAAGENGGAVITEVNVARNLTALGSWDGKPAKFTVARPAGEHVAVLLQAANGAVLGLASL